MTMIIHHPASDPAPVARMLAAIAAMASFVAKRFAAARRHRHDMATLASLDGRTLADMGLTRADVRDALSLPLWRDPTAALAERRRERDGRDYRAIFTQLVRERHSPTLAPSADTLRHSPTSRAPRLTQ